jgi:hypothetical protein
MFGPYMYQLYEAERRRTLAELRAADVRRGELAAALSRPVRAAGRLAIARMQRARRAPRAADIRPMPWA